jgi:hypothetical protein
MQHNAVVDVTLTWPSGTIPYVLSASFGIYFTLNTHSTALVHNRQ